MSQTSSPPLLRSRTLFAPGPLSMGGARPNHYRRSDGSLAVEKQVVFRSGTFRDSTGRQGTWEQLHIDQIVANFNLLRGRNILADIPVRDGHPGFLIHGMEGSGKVVGWHTDLNVQTLDTEKGQTSYLLANYVLTDPDAITKYENGTYRNRSSEIGTYVTNDEAEFWPAYMGFAFVDIPAVEGLNDVQFSKSASSAYAGRDVIFLFDRENPLSTPPQPNTQPAQGAPIMPFGLFAQPQPVSPASTGTVPAAQTSQPQAFMINGNPVSDVGQVQAYITGLEAFRNETLEGARVSFVESLVTDGKLMASQKESMTAFAKGLSSEQFMSWKAAMEAAPQLSVLGVHGAPNSAGTNGAVPGSAQAAANSELETAQGIVRMHQMAGKSEEFIKNTDSYKTVQRLTAAGVTS